MSEVCELLVTTGEGQILAGVIELNDDGTLSSGYSDGYEHLVSEVLDTPVFGVDPKEDSKLWFEALPLQYTGSYFRVAKVGGIKAYGTSEGVRRAWDTRGRKGPEVEMVPGVRKMTGEDAKYLQTWRQIANRQVATGDLKRSVRKAANVAEWIANDWEDENYGSRSKADKSQFFVVQTPENGIVGSINIHPGIEFGYDHISSLATRPDVISGVVKEHGVGTKLMIQAAKYAASRNHGLDLSALDGAEGFYRKLGMHETPPASRDKMSEFEWTADEVKQMSEGKVN